MPVTRREQAEHLKELKKGTKVTKTLRRIRIKIKFQNIKKNEDIDKKKDGKDNKKKTNGNQISNAKKNKDNKKE